jgi:FMN reductase
MALRPFIVGIGGTTRSGSTSERALTVALERARALGCETRIFGAGDLPGEPYDPAAPGRSPQAQAMIDALRRADGVIIATPAYHGGISGLVKNAIDYTEDMRTDERVYLEGRSVGCIVCADGAQAMGTTMMALRAVVHALRGWPTPYGAAIASSTKPFGAPGRDPDPAAIKACETVGEEVARFAVAMQAARPA